MKRSEVVAAAALAGFAGFILFASARLNFGSLRMPQTGFFPKTLAILLLILASIELLRTLRGPPVKRTHETIEREAWTRIGATLAAMIGFALVLERLGFLLTTFALMVLLLRAIEATRWPKVLLIAAVTALGSYGLFAWLLGVPLPAGLLGV